ncbi:MAG: hypothetical protein GY850_29430, partial [bacterium]|nr:hypothetical protein [bacterium]
MPRKTNRLPINYSVKNIIASILLDNPKAHNTTAGIKKRLYQSVQKKVASHPELSSILSLKHIRSYPIKGSRFFARIGILPPELVVVDQRIKDLCSLP